MKKINNLMSILKVFFLVTSLGFVNTSHAISIGLTLWSDQDIPSLLVGDQVTFTVGITPDTPITGYTLDIRFDETELAFVSSEQLAPFFGGNFVPPYLLDPATTAGDDGSSGLATSGSGRAAYLSTSDSVPVGDLFSLTFTVQDLIADNNDDLLIGLLDERADAVSQPLGADQFTFSNDVVSAQVGTVPVPAAVWFFGSGLVGLLTLRNKREVV